MFHVHYSVTVPTTLFDQPAPRDLVKSVRDAIHAAFVDAFGGSTESQAIGRYRSGVTNNIIMEPVYRIEAWATERNDSILEDAVELVKRELQQEGVLYEINDLRAYIG